MMWETKENYSIVKKINVLFTCDWDLELMMFTSCDIDIIFKIKG